MGHPRPSETNSNMKKNEKKRREKEKKQLSVHLNEIYDL